MRKKSHIALSMYLADELQIEELLRHRKAFYFGSILPDLNPKMVAEPHEFDTSWEKIKALLCRIEADAKNGEYSERIMWTQIGMAMHYLADYFTFPHNTCFEGNLKDHCIHESVLKYVMRAYLRTSEAGKVFDEQRTRAREIRNTEALFAYIEETHEAYMQAETHSVTDDCRWIVELCACSALVISAIVCGEEWAASWRSQVA